MFSRPSSPFTIALVLFGLVLAWLVLRPSKSAPMPRAVEKPSVSQTASGPVWRARTRSGRGLDPGSQPSAPLGVRLASVDAEEGEHQLSEFELAQFLAVSRTNAVSLVAAFETTHRREFLEQAAEKFPADPLVQAQILMNNVLPDDRAKWIEALKKSSPGNSLPNFLLAVDLLKSGDAPAAVKELQAAQGKSFRDYSRETSMAIEEAYLSAGRTPAEAKAFGSSDVLLPALAPFKDTVRKLADVAEQYRLAGDPESARTVLESMWQTGHQVRAAGTEGTLIAELVGLAMENVSLQRMDAASTPAFLPHTVQEELAANKDYRLQIRASANVFSAWLPTAQDNELMIYFDRVRMFGEHNAMNWLKERRPDLVAPPTNP